MCCTRLVQLCWKGVALVTPHEVIYRYLELVDPGPADLDKLLCLISSDADLLSRWLKILQIQAQSSLLHERLGALTSEELKGMVDAQIWTVSPTPTSARLSLDQWTTVLRAAQLAEVLAGHFDDHDDDELAERHEDVRVRALLALSGVHISVDRALADLIEFRGARPDLLEDAALELKIFVVIDAIELGRDEGLAEELLGLNVSDYQELQVVADRKVLERLQFLSLEIDDDVDWSHRIWLRQQISAATAAFQGCNDFKARALMHSQVSRTLFSKAPMILIQSDDLERFELFPNNELSVQRASRSSGVAQAVRTGTNVMLLESFDLSVVDRQLMQRLACDNAILRATDSEPSVVFMADADDDLDVETALQLYVESFSKGLPNKQVSSHGDRELSTYREEEVARLREIVHEANNPLSIVHNYLHILELRLQDDPTVTEQIQLITSELQRASQIFARARDIPDAITTESGEPGMLSDLDLVAWLGGIATLQAGALANRQIGVSFEPTIGHYQARIDKSSLHQVLSNLLKNAGEATASGGTVTLVFSHQHFRNDVSGFEISVGDTGAGLPEAVLDNLRGKKDTVKGGDHQGIGLSVVYRLVAEMGAELDLRTSSKGTLFSLFLHTDE